MLKSLILISFLIYLCAPQPLLYDSTNGGSNYVQWYYQGDGSGCQTTFQLGGNGIEITSMLIYLNTGMDGCLFVCLLV